MNLITASFNYIATILNLKRFVIFVLLGKEDKSDCYACLIPIMKAALEKVRLEFESICTAFSANLFDEFQIVRQEETWKNWI